MIRAGENKKKTTDFLNVDKSISSQDKRRSEMEWNQWMIVKPSSSHIRSGLNFTNILCTAFTRGAQKRKKDSQVISLFTLSKSMSVKVECKYVGEIDHRVSQLGLRSKGPFLMEFKVCQLCFHMLQKVHWLLVRTIGVHEGKKVKNHCSDTKLSCFLTACKYCNIKICLGIFHGIFYESQLLVP